MNFNVINMLWFVGVGLIGIVLYFAVLLIRERSFYRDLPCPPHSLFWGHLKLMGEYIKKLPPGSYIQTALTQMKLDHDLPDVFYLDLWPAGPRFLVCTSPDACAIPTTRNTFQMAGEVASFFKNNVGTTFIEATNGPLWKHLHKILAPGLTPNAVKGYTNSIVDEAKVLHSRLGDVARSGQVVDIRSELGIYPFQVIGTVFFGETLSAQIYEDLKTAVDVQGAINATNNPIVKWRLRSNMNHHIRRIDTAIETKVRTRFAKLQQEKVLPTKNNVTNLLDRMLLSHVQENRSLEKASIKLILENIKGFLVAGYGTTADTSSYIFMLLSLYPEALRKLREEHNHVFDKNFDITVKMLKENPGLLNELEYTTAVINETLRMFPVGIVVRSPPSDLTTFEYKGREYPIKDHIIGIASHTMHYDPEYFDEPKVFKPERFLASNSTFSRNAYRPFERGLRACLGQSLAMDEMKIMLLLVFRWFDFDLKDQQVAKRPLFSFTDLDTKLGKHAFQSWTFTATPTGPVKMKVNLTE